VEYGLALALIAMLSIAALRTLGNSLGNMLESVGHQIAASAGNTGTGGSASGGLGANPMVEAYSGMGSFQSMAPPTVAGGDAILQPQPAPQVAGVSLMAVPPDGDTSSNP
jgi:Flp pilus assembly pilin Flp